MVVEVKGECEREWEGGDGVIEYDLNPFYDFQTKHMYSMLKATAAAAAA